MAMSRGPFHLGTTLFALAVSAVLVSGPAQYGELSPMVCSDPITQVRNGSFEAGYQACSGGSLDLLSASVSDGRVHMTVTGSGETITGWETWTYALPGDGCVAPDAYFYAGHPSRGTESLVDFWDNPNPCRTAPPNGTVKWWARTTDVPATYVHGTRLCNAWDAPFHGYPCITIER